MRCVWWYCYFTLVGSRVLWSVCLSVCLSVCPWACLWNRWTDVYEIFCAAPCGRGSVLLWWRCDTLCTCSFMDDVTFGHSGPCGATGGGVWCLWMPCCICQSCHDQFRPKTWQMMWNGRNVNFCTGVLQQLSLCIQSHCVVTWDSCGPLLACTFHSACWSNLDWTLFVVFLVVWVA